MASTGPKQGIMYGWSSGESGWDTGMDNNLKLVDTLLSLSVLDKDLSTPPASPTEGATYIIGASPTGVWAGKAGQVAIYRGAAWNYYVCKLGQIAYVTDEDTFYGLKSAGWALI